MSNFLEEVVLTILAVVVIGVLASLFVPSLAKTFVRLGVLMSGGM